MELNKSEKIKTEPDIDILGPEQWQEYRAIRLKAFRTDPTAFGESYEREEKKSEAEMRKQLSDPNYRAYVAKIDNKTASLAVYMLFVPQHVEHCAMISSVFTDPEFRRSGLGEKLLRKVLDDLHQNPKITRVRLSVRVDNEAAKKMYEKLGFVQCGIGRKEVKVDGKYYDQAQMDLIFEDKL
ncbi:MAG: GNAT family N-acetyltransferase [Patescibacteria group bacterium]